MMRQHWRLLVSTTAAFLLATILWAASMATAVLAQDDPQANPSDLILVGIPPNLSEPDVQTLFVGQGLEVVRVWPDFNLAALRPIGPAARSTALMMANLQALPDVRFVEANHRIEAALVQTALFTPTDTLYSQQWALELIRMPTAWTISRGDPSVIVAVIDSGVEMEHEDLPEAAFWINFAELTGQPGVDDDGNGYVDDLRGWDWVERDNHPNDRFGHGTHVAGTILAALNNSSGVAGMAPGLQIMPLRILNERGGGWISDLVDALDYARQHGARIVNLSLEGSDSAALHAAIQRLHAEGILIVAATGNHGNRVFWPAAYPETLAVAAVDANDQRALFSNAGPETDLAAPGVQILSTYKNNTYFKKDGTSMAVPHVAALGGLLWSLRPDLSREEIVELMRNTAVDANADQYPGPDKFLGAGRIDAAAALLKASEGVQLDVELPVGSYLQIGQRLEVPARLTVAGQGAQRAPVRGGVVHYEVYKASRDHRTDDLPEWSISDEAGYATLDLILPEQPGLHTLVMRSGLQAVSLDLVIQDDPLYFTITPVRSTIEVGEGETEIGFQVHNESGNLFLHDLRVTLRTSLGHFADGQQTRTLLISNGYLTETLYAGAKVGSAEVIIEGAGQSQRSTVEVTSGPPYRIEGPSHLYSVGNGNAAVIDLTLKIYDRYENPVQDGVTVNFYSFGATISPASPIVLNGEVSTQITLNPSLGEPVAIWALIPGTFVVYQANAYRLPYQSYFPLVQR
jgi:subtilisin family serine protease